jgi:hypothetical protein
MEITREKIEEIIQEAINIAPLETKYPWRFEISEAPYHVNFYTGEWKKEKELNLKHNVFLAGNFISCLEIVANRHEINLSYCFPNTIEEKDGKELLASFSFGQDKKPHTKEKILLDEVVVWK